MKLKFRPARQRARIVLALGVLLLCACGHYGTTSRTAKDIKSIHIPFFENRTSEPNLEITVTERIINNLISDNTLRVTDRDEADAILEGEVTSFTNQPFSFNADLNAEEYHVVVRVKVSLRNRRLNEPIWQDRAIVGDGSYFIEQVDGGNTFDGAVDESIREITDRILNMTVQDW